MRVFTLYGQRHGSVMAAGAAYKMFFSIAALLVVGFSILGIIASGNQQLQDFVVQGVAKTTPGLVDTGEGGLATPQQLFRTRGFGWALVISTAVSFLTSLRWIAGLREGMRGVFGLLKSQSNVVLAKIKDLGVLVLLGISLILTTGLSVIASTALQTIIDFLDLESTFSVMLTRVASLVAMLPGRRGCGDPVPSGIGDHHATRGPAAIGFHRRGRIHDPALLFLAAAG